MKDSRRTGAGIPKRLVRAGLCFTALCAAPALAHDSWVEEHVAAAYDYVLLKGPASGRTVLLAAAGPDDTEVEKGKATFDAKCALCHSIGAGEKIGPDLKGVTRRHADQWLTWWLLETDRMQKTDADAKALLAKYKTPMPNLGLKPAEARELLQFLHRADRSGLAKN
ncbi:MAG TPA: cytochrome c [Burkholderiales bacterium]|nr:cytochrome c [Burkholderiales bacterium]